jgi:hypothetical protein
MTSVLTTRPKLAVPNRFLPEQATEMFPAGKATDLTEMKRAGWARLGIVAAVVDDRQQILMLAHRASAKSPHQALGPLAETAQRAREGRGIQVESTAHTLSRAILEELGVRDPASLRLTARMAGAWAINRWPVGIRHPDQSALAVCPVVHIGAEGREQLIDTFAGTEEIEAIAFMDPGDIVTHDNLRPGVYDWLSDIAASGQLDANGSEQHPVDLPDPSPFIGGADVILTNPEYA